MTVLDIRAKSAADQIKARQIIERCLPLNVYREVFVNCYNPGKWYFIGYKAQGYTVGGIDTERGVLAH